ncbi:TolC family protein [Desulfurobacterium crinifex]
MYTIKILLCFCFLLSVPAFAGKFVSDFPVGNGFQTVSLYYLEEKVLNNNLLLKDKETEIKILQESLENFKGENHGDVSVGLTYYPSSSYSDNIIGYKYGISGRWRYPLLGQYGDMKFKEEELKTLINVKKAEYERLKNKLLYDLRSAYMNYYYSYMVEDKLKNAIFELQDIEARLKERYNRKLSLWTDVLTVDTLITKLRATLAGIYENRLKSLARIRTLIADPYLPDFVPQLEYDKNLVNLYLPPSNELVEFAKEHRKDIEFEKKAYELLNRAAKNYSDTYPKAWVSVLGSATSYDLDTFDSGIGFSLDFSFPWRKSQAEKALKAERKLRAQREGIRVKLAKTELITAIQNAVSNFEIYRSKYAAFKQEYETVKQNREVFEKRLNAGLYSGGDGLIKLASLINQEVGSYNLMMDSMKNMLVHYFSILNSIGVRELPWIMRMTPVNYVSYVPPPRLQTDISGVLLFSYVWSSKKFLGNPSLEAGFIKECESIGLDGIYLSLDGKQIKEFLGTFKGNQKLMKFISLAKSRGLSVQLLLGENTWIYPENRDKLIEIVKLFNRFNRMVGAYGFDGLHLDIEPHALSEWKFERAKLVSFYVETLSEVKQVSEKPVFVDIPPGYLNVPFQGKPLAEKVFQIADGINVMAYSTNINYLKRVSSDFYSLGMSYRKPVTIALSVERNLSDMESFYRRNISNLKKAIRVIKNSGIDSVAFQDFKNLVDYLKEVSLKFERTFLVNVSLPSKPAKSIKSATIPKVQGIVGGVNVELKFFHTFSLPRKIIIGQER